VSRYREMQCMDCARSFTWNVDDDCEVVLCPKCSKDFEDYVAEEESRSYGFKWWKEFVGIHGHRPERERRERSRLVDESLA
jgi:hypothetical protein